MSLMQHRLEERPFHATMRRMGTVHLAFVPEQIRFETGQVFADRFEILGRLGRGGMATVYRVFDRTRGCEVAMKVLAPVMAHGELLTRFVREYRVASRLKDERIVRAYEFFALDGVFSFTMDLVEGGSLADQSRAKKLAPGLAVGLMLQVLSALDYLHSKNITHRDINPKNMLVSGPLPIERQGDDPRTVPIPRLRLMDFGIAKIGDLSETMGMGYVLGTLRYIAPETDAQGADPRADLFAVGVVLHELLTGKHPLGGDGRTRVAMADCLHGESKVPAVTEFPPEVPVDLRQVLGSLLSFDPSRRPRTAALVYDVLRKWWEREKPSYVLPESPPLSGSPYLAASPLVGREPELSIARNFLNALTFSQPLCVRNVALKPQRRDFLCPSVLVVSGSPGVGKSTLCWQFLREARLRGFQLLVGQCKPEVEQPYEGMADILRELNGLTSRWQLSSTPPAPSPRLTPPDATGVDSLAEQSASREVGGRPTDGAMTALASRDLPIENGSPPQSAGSDDRPFWRRGPSMEDPEYELLRREAKDGIEAIRQNELRQRLLQEQISARLLCYAERTAVVLVIEDVQWADPSTTNLLAFIMRSAALARGQGYAGRLAFVLTHRPASPENAVYRTQAALQQQAVYEQAPVRIDLEPLSREDSATLTAALLMEPSSEDLLRFSEVLFDNRDPTPLYVEQALRLLLYQGHLTKGQFDSQGRWNGHWNLNPSLAEMAQIPATVQQAVGERAARLSVQTQSLLAAASVVGRRFGSRLLADAAGLHDSEVLDCLDEAVEVGFVQPLDMEAGATVSVDEERMYRFAHDRYREAIYERMGEAQARELHLRIASSIEHLSGGSADAAEALAHHYGSGDEFAKAHEWGVRAADWAMIRGAYDRASDLYAAALPCAQRAGLSVEPSIHGRYADACVANGQFHTAEEQYTLRLASLQPGRERRDTQRRAAELRYRQGDFRNATAPLEALVEEMGYRSPRTKLGIALALVFATWRAQIVLIFGLPFAKHFIGYPAKNVEDLDCLMRARYAFVECYSFVDYTKSLYHGTSFAVTGLFLGDFPFRPAIVAALVYGLSNYGLFRMARRTAKIAGLLLEGDTDTSAAATAYYLLLGAALNRGEACIDLVAPALRTAEASGDIQRRHLARLFGFLPFFFEGRLGAAASIMRNTADLGQRYALPTFEGWALLQEGMQMRLLGDPEGALTQMEAALRVFKCHNDVMPGLCARASISLAKSLLPSTLDRESRLALIEDGLRLLTEWQAFNLRISSQTGWLLLSIGLNLVRVSDAPATLWGRVFRVWALAKRDCYRCQFDTPLHLATGALLWKASGNERRAFRMMRQAVALSNARKNFDAISLCYRAAQHVFPAGSEECQRYAELDQALMTTMRNLPVTSFQAILRGEAGVSPLDPVPKEWSGTAESEPRHAARSA